MRGYGHAEAHDCDACSCHECDPLSDLSTGRRLRSEPLHRPAARQTRDDKQSAAHYIFASARSAHRSDGGVGIAVGDDGNSLLTSPLSEDCIMRQFCLAMSEVRDRKAGSIGFGEARARQSTEAARYLGDTWPAGASFAA
jgi:hypothetical protein